MKIEIFGSGCRKCEILYINTERALNDLGISAEMSKVNDPAEIVNRGVMSTPALVIDGDIVATGTVLTPNQIKDVLEKRKIKKVEFTMKK